VQLRGEVVRQALVRPGGNLDVVLGRCQVADRRARGNVQQRSTDYPHKHRLRLEVVDGEDGLGCVPVHELDAKDLSLGKGCADLDVELWLSWRAAEFSIDDFLSLDVMSVRSSSNLSPIDVIAGLADARTYLYGGGGLECEKRQQGQCGRLEGNHCV
jgi:hypothetical protein